jgi:NAD(P)-dependent dehydrogenase (short-subunit alcohol dehydrogenase family)
MVRNAKSLLWVISGHRSGARVGPLCARSRHVNAIAPGLVDTASNIAAMKPKDLKRWTKREDIAETVVFLASPAASGITGQVLAVTGWGL